jgi:heme exporter protein C
MCMIRWFKANWMLYSGLGLLVLNSIVIFTATSFNRIVYAIFFYHVAAAWVSYFSFAMSLVFHVIYLRKAKMEHYLFGKNSVVVGVVFAAVTLVTGSLWFNATSGGYTNVFWTWSDPRQTTTLVLFLAYFSYLIFGSSIKERDRGARMVSMLGIVIFPMVPLSYLSVIFFNSLHPLINPNPGQTGNLYWDTVKLVALIVNVLGTSLLYMDIARRLASIDLKKLELERITRQRLEAN